MQKIKINQFISSFNDQTGMGKTVLLIKKILLKMGFESNIYIDYNIEKISPEYNIYHINQFIENKNNILIYHFGIENERHNYILNLKDKKILYYQNITPSHFFESKLYKSKSDIGREQIYSSVNQFFAAMTASNYSAKELIYYGYKNVKVLPLLVDSDVKVMNKLKSDTFNIIFIGRIIQNKCQHKLIELAYSLKLKGVKNFKIYIIGGNHFSNYYNYLFDYIKNLKLEKEVIITGHVTDEELMKYYSKANLYISFSEHEGFGMPLIEAMNHNIPVLAYDVTAIKDTIGSYGLFNMKATNTVADIVISYIKSNKKIEVLLQHQKKHIKQFENKYLEDSLSKYLNNIGVLDD